jgi:hypothetical protein
MSTKPEASAVPSGEAARLELLRVALRDLLLRVKRAVDDEIRSYPTPIPRCDAQFNFLYEQRSRISLFLARTDVVVKADDDSNKSIDILAEFVASAPFGGDATEQALRERIKAALSRAAPAPVDDLSLPDPPSA